MKDDVILTNAELIGNVIPNLNKCAGEILVIQVEDGIFQNPETLRFFAKDIICLKNLGINPVIIQNCKKTLIKTLKEFGQDTSQFEKGEIASSKEMSLIEMISCSFSQEISSFISKEGGYAVAISGKDSKLIEAEKNLEFQSDSKVMKLDAQNYFGKINKLNPELIMGLEDSEMIPVISPIGTSNQYDQSFNGYSGSYFIDANCLSLEIAKIIGANKLIFLNEKTANLKNETIISSDLGAYLKQNKLKDDGIKKQLQICKDAVVNSVDSAHILNPEIRHIILLEIFTNGSSGLALQRATISAK